MDKVKIEDFLKIEVDYGLYNLKICDIYIWYYLRCDIWQNQIAKQLYNLGNAQNPILDHKKRHYIKMVFRSLKSPYKVKRADVAVFCSSHRTLFNGKYKCEYTDDLIKRMDNCVAYENPTGYEHKKPAYTKDLIYTDRIFVIARIVSQIKKRRKRKFQRIIHECKRRLTNALLELSNVYQVKIDIERNILFAANIIIYNTELSKLLKRLLTYSNPKVVVEVCHYNSFNMLLNEIASQMNIKTIELMHGGIGINDVPYQYALDSIPFKGLPDYLFTFSDYWNDIVHLPKQNNHVISTGFPLFERRMENYRHIKKQVKNILFISQGTIGQELSHLAVKVNKLIDRSKYNIIYKLHPGEVSIWESSFSWLKESDIEVVTDSDRSIYEYFMISEYLIGVYSTAIYEGIGCGLETYIYDIAFAEEMDSLVQKGYAEYIHSAEELVNFLNKKPEDLKEKNDLWKENALNNIMKEIQLICNKK